MSINENTDLVLREYKSSPMPTSAEALITHLQEEFRRLEDNLRNMSEAAIQVVDTPPISPRKGSVKYVKSPWDPLGDGTENILVVYNGTAWVAV
jgi:hypothetical protein